MKTPPGWPGALPSSQDLTATIRGSRLPGPHSPWQHVIALLTLGLVSPPFLSLPSECFLNQDMVL